MSSLNERFIKVMLSDRANTMLCTDSARQIRGKVLQSPLQRGGRRIGVIRASVIAVEAMIRVIYEYRHVGLRRLDRFHVTHWNVGIELTEVHDHRAIW